jgi:hypothetical protein
VSEQVVSYSDGLTAEKVASVTHLIVGLMAFIAWGLP